MIKNIAVDLGTCTTLIYANEKGIVLKEPSLVIVDKDSNKVIKVGHEAAKLKGRTSNSVEAVRPLCDGVISKYRHTLIMLKRFFKKCFGNFFIRPEMTVCVPCKLSDVEEHAVRDACIEAGARSVYLIDSPLAAAIGAGVDVNKPTGNLVIDIGGGTTDIAVICDGGIVISSFVKIGGDAMDEEIVKYVKRKYNVSISKQSAEKAKINAGTVYRRYDGKSYTVKGKSPNSTTPETVTLTPADIREALQEPITGIVEEICSVLEKTPPELVSDISKKGILMVGGSSLIHGFDELISSVTAIACNVAKNPTECAVKGAGKAKQLGLNLKRNSAFLRQR